MTQEGRSESQKALQKLDCPAQTTADALYDRAGTKRQVRLGRKGQTNPGWQSSNDIDLLTVD